jgi:tol-pal system protein YbgF
MQRACWVVGIVAFIGLVPGMLWARDVQLRTQSDADATGTSFSAAPAATGSGGKQFSTEDRLVRLENIVDGQMLDIVMRLQAMEREIQVLRGEIEVHSHQLEEQAKKQRDLYVVLDQRLQALEKQIQGLNSSSGVGAPAATAAATASTAKAELSAKSATEDDQQAYQQALDHLYQQQFDKAISGFRTYVQKNPQGRYAHVSQYWIAEAYYALGQFKTAVSEYQKLIDTYPASPKLAEAMVKMGEGYTKLNEYSRAQKIFEQVVRSYPGTDEARTAQVLLQKIKTMPKAATAPAVKKKHN